MNESAPQVPPATPQTPEPPQEPSKPPEPKPEQKEKATRETLAARMDRLEGKIDAWMNQQTAPPKANQSPSTPQKPAVEIIEVQAEVTEKPRAKTDGGESTSAATPPPESQSSGDGGDAPPRARTFADNLFLRPR